MEEKAWLLCKIVEEKKRTTVVRSQLFDETSFEIEPDKWSVAPIETAEDKPLAWDAWLAVTYHGQAKKDKKVSITLPAPILGVGERISVDSSWIKLDL